MYTYVYWIIYMDSHGNDVLSHPFSQGDSQQKKTVTGAWPEQLVAAFPVPQKKCRNSSESQPTKNGQWGDGLGRVSSTPQHKQKLDPRLEKEIFRRKGINFQASLFVFILGSNSGLVAKDLQDLNARCAPPRRREGNLLT